MDNVSRLMGHSYVRKCPENGFTGFGCYRTNFHVYFMLTLLREFTRKLHRSREIFLCTEFQSETFSVREGLSPRKLVPIKYFFSLMLLLDLSGKNEFSFFLFHHRSLLTYKIFIL